MKGFLIINQNQKHAFVQLANGACFSTLWSVNLLVNWWWFLWSVLSFWTEE